MDEGPNNISAELNKKGYWSLCSTECRVQILRRWLRVHFEEAARIGTLPPSRVFLVKGLHCRIKL